MSPTLAPATSAFVRSHRTRVLVVSISLAGGGAERFTSNLLNHLDLDFFDPHLCVVRPDFNYPLRDEIPVTSLDKFKATDLPRTVYRLRHSIRSFQPDVILSTITFCNRLVAMALPRISDRPRWIARIGCNYQRSLSSPERLATRFLYARADSLVANSHGAANAFAASFSRSGARISVISNPTDLEHLQALAVNQTAVTSSVPVILTAGRLEKVKRQDLLLRAFAIVRSATRAQLWICGDGPLKSELQRQASQLGLADDVRWLGFVDNPYAIMKSADVFALSSDSEGMPNALIEAQGLGLPAVSFDCDYGPREVIESNRTGFLVPPGNCGKLAGALHRLVTDDSLRKSMGQAASHQTRRRFSLAASMREWQNLLGSQSDSSVRPTTPETQAA